MLRKILAHTAIVFGGMCFVLYVVDAIKGGAMSFMNNDIAKAFVAVLALTSIANSAISLVGMTNELRMAAKLRGARPAQAAQPRPAQRTATPVRTAASVRTVAPARTAASVRTAAPARPAARPAARTVVRPAQQTTRSRNPYASNR